MKNLYSSMILIAVLIAVTAPWIAVETESVSGATVLSRDSIELAQVIGGDDCCQGTEEAACGGIICEGVHYICEGTGLGNCISIPYTGCVRIPEEIGPCEGDRACVG